MQEPSAFDQRQPPVTQAVAIQDGCERTARSSRRHRHCIPLRRRRPPHSTEVWLTSKHVVDVIVMYDLWDFMDVDNGTDQVSGNKKSMVPAPEGRTSCVGGESEVSLGCIIRVPTESLISSKVLHLAYTCCCQHHPGRVPQSAHMFVFAAGTPICEMLSCLLFTSFTWDAVRAAMVCRPHCQFQ